MLRTWLSYLLYPKIPVIYVVAAFAVAYLGFWQYPAVEEVWVQTFEFVEIEEWVDEIEEPDQELLNADLPDFTVYSNVVERKASFFSFVQSFVEYENDRILALREELEPIWAEVDSGGAASLSDAQRERLLEVAERYRLDPEEMDIAQISRELELRVDVIPPSLALAQAANESAWGTSRFAREGNNLFGQWCFTEGCGLVPQRRVPGATHEVRVFDSVADAVHAYFRNINTNEVYDYLRELRLDMREQGEALDSLVLAYGLTRYSERGADYTAELQSMIRFNELATLDQQYQFQS